MSRTWLFVPGHRPERWAKAMASGAHRVIVDLEDAVAPADKPAARAAVAAWLAGAPPSPTVPVFVRLNAVGTPWHADDLALLDAPALGGLMLPKAEDPVLLAALASRRPNLPLVPLVESAAGLAAARALAAAPGVERLAFGHIDLQADLGLRNATEDDLLPWRCELVLASRLAGIAPPLDGVTVAFDDPARLAVDVARARRLGFGGKLCIHPAQLAGVHEGFQPSADEVTWAQRVLAVAASSGGAAVALDGGMVDRPVILRAEAVLRDAGLAG
ncbi:MAG: CoA ester lyase [Burkholderiaceae bacterium]|nr:CoA ester lyase [Burkholderiaceae bacterium]